MIPLAGKMKGGRVTDTEIIEALATKVMGWIERPQWRLPADRWYTRNDKREWRKEAKSGWNPLENIKDAWMVVERMGEVHHLGSKHGFLLTKRDGELWYCEFERPNWEDVEADNPSRAICLAALKAVGVEVTE